ncbi:MAG: hypothetical protein ACLUUJ_03910 [Acutalibacteraceae bacterium]
MKIIGCVLILLTSGLTGLFLSHRLYEKVRFWEEWLTFLRQTETQIRFGARPLEEIFGDYGGSFRPVLCRLWSGACFIASGTGVKPFPCGRRESPFAKWGDELGGSVPRAMVLCSAMRAEAEERKTKARKRRWKKAA